MADNLVELLQEKVRNASSSNKTDNDILEELINKITNNGLSLEDDVIITDYFSPNQHLTITRVELKKYLIPILQFSIDNFFETESRGTKACPFNVSNKFRNPDGSYKKIKINSKRGDAGEIKESIKTIYEILKDEQSENYKLIMLSLAMLKQKNETMELTREYDDLSPTIQRHDIIHDPDQITYDPTTDQREVINNFLSPLFDNLSEVNNKVKEAVEKRKKRITVYNRLMQYLADCYGDFVKTIKKAFPKL